MLPKLPKLLLYYSQLKVYHYQYNVIKLIKRNSFWYCFRKRTLVFEKKKMVKKYCLLCMLEMDENFETCYWYKIKKRPLELLFFALCVFDDLKKVADFNKSIVVLWSGEVTYGGEIMVKGLNGKCISKM